MVNILLISGMKPRLWLSKCWKWVSLMLKTRLALYEHGRLHGCPRKFRFFCDRWLFPSFRSSSWQALLQTERLCNLISVSHNTSYNLRSSTNHNLAILKRPKTNYLQNPFGYSSRMVWNGIPINIQKSPSINAFKSNFKLFLQTSQ